MAQPRRLFATDLQETLKSYREFITQPAPVTDTKPTEKTAGSRKNEAHYCCCHPKKPQHLNAKVLQPNCQNDQGRVSDSSRSDTDTEEET